MRAFSFNLRTGRPVRLYTMTRVDGSVIRFTPWDRPITIDGDTWSPMSGHPRARIQEYAITERFDGTPSSTQLGVGAYSGGPFDPIEIALGMFDYADLDIDLTSAANPVEREFIFTGNVGVTQRTVRDSITFSAQNPYAFPIKQLVEPFALLCMRVFGDAFCGVDKAALQAACTVDQVLNLTNLTLTALPVAEASSDSWYRPGRIKFTSGRNKNRIFPIGFWQAGSLQVTTFLPVGVCTRAGDTAIIWPDCDRTLGGGCTKYSNQSKHGGFPRYAGAKAAATSDF